MRIKYSTFVLTTLVAILTLCTPIFAGASAEVVTVVKIFDNDDNGIIVRSNGDAYQIEKGTGCISFWRYEGKQVLVSSPGIFLGVGAELLLPNDNQKCRIWNSKELGQWGGTSANKNLGDNVIESQISGEFEGWEGETIVKLVNGQIWEQNEYYYYYYYSYMPKVMIFKTGAGYKMKVEGVDRAVGVTKLR